MKQSSQPDETVMAFPRIIYSGPIKHMQGIHPPMLMKILRSLPVTTFFKSNVGLGMLAALFEYLLFSNY